MFKSTKTKLIAYIGALAITPTLVLGVYYIIVNQAKLEENIFNDLRTQSEANINLLQNSLVKAENDLSFLSSSFSFLNLVEAISGQETNEIKYWTDATTNLFKSFLHNKPNYLNLKFINPDGIELVRIESNEKDLKIVGEETRQDQSNSSYFLESLKLDKNEIYISPLSVNKGSAKAKKADVLVIRYATPVFDGNDQLRGVFVLNVLANSFLDEFKKMNIRQSILINQEGYFLAHPDTAKKWSPNSDKRFTKYYETDIIDTLLAGNTGLIEPGDGSIMYYAPVYYDSNNKCRYWVSIVRDFEENAFAELNSFGYLLVFLLICITIIAVLIATYLNKKINSPLKDLSDAAQKIADCDIGFQISNSQEFEIGSFTNSFNQLASSLKEKTRIIESIANGNLNLDYSPRSSSDVLDIAIEKMTKNLQKMNSEFIKTIESQKSGNLDCRCETHGLSGVYHNLAQEFNGVLDVVIMPIYKMLEILEKYAAGDLSEKMTNLPGQQIAISNGVNLINKNLKSLIEEVTRLNQDAGDGNLSSRGNIELFKGDYHKIISGMNTTFENILNPVYETVRVLEKMSEGDLTDNISGEFKGDHKLMKKTLNTTIDRLNETIFKIQQMIDHVSFGAEHVSDSSQTLSQSSTDEASALQQISASMNELNRQIEKNSKNANGVKELSESAMLNTKEGNKHMQEMVDSMKGINSSSSRISNIIKTIDEIAFQTNLLALNASVEAARAGSHGKGFAVVAEEVRSLAQRSAKAAKETTEIIEDSILKVKQGSQTADNTAKSFSRINEQIIEINNLISEISAASSNQAIGINQISNGLSLIDKATQSNTASSEETAAAAQELSSLAIQLKHQISKLKLKNGTPRQQLPVARASKKRKTAGKKLIAPLKKTSQSKHKFGDVAEKKDQAADKEKDPSSVITLDDDDFGMF